MLEVNESLHRVATYAKIKKFETGEGGRTIVVKDFSLSGGQLEFIDSLAAGQKEVLIQIVNSSRGTLFTGQDEVDLSARVTKNSMAMEVDAIGLLILKVASDMRARMLKKFNDGFTGWDDEPRLESFKDLAVKKVKQGDWIDALNYIAMIMNLEKPIAGANDEVEGGEDEGTPLLDNLLEVEQGKVESPGIKYVCKKCRHKFSEPKQIKGGKAVCPKPKCGSSRIEVMEAEPAVV